MPVTAGALLTSVCINGSVGCVCFGVFGALRRWKVTAKLYEPKRFTGAERDPGRRPARLATPLPQGLLAWIPAVWNYREADVIDLCGLDVAVFFRLLHLGVKLFSFISLLCLLVVMPVNFSGGYLERHKRPRVGAGAAPFGWSGSALHSPQQQHGSGDAGGASYLVSNAPSNSSSSAFIAALGSGSSGSSVGSGVVAPGLMLGNISDAIHTNLDLLTLSNVPPGSAKMWVHLAAVYVITLVALKLLWDLSRDVAFKRAAFLALEGSRATQGSSVLVSDIPGLEWGTPLNRLQMSWVKWVLPQRLFRRGFDAPPPPPDPSARPRDDEPLRVQDVWREAVQVLRSNGGNVQALVEREMRQVYGTDAVAAVVPVHETRGLDAAATKYCELQSQLEDLLDYYQCHLPAVQQQQQQLSQQQDVESHGAAGGPARSGGKDELRQPLLLEGSSSNSNGGNNGGGSGSRAKGLRGGSSSGPKRKTAVVVGPRWGAWGVERFGLAPRRVDALAFYTEALQQQLAELQQLQQAALRQLPRPAAVVTFREQLMSTLAAASLHCYEETAWSISPAPHPDELQWATLGTRGWELAVRQLLLWAAFWLLVVFYAPVVAAIQAPVNMDNLRKIPLLAQLLQLPLVTSILQGFLPSLVLLLFLAAAPYLLHGLIARTARLHSITAIDAQLIGLWFLFQLFAVFVFSFISGTALSQLQGLIDDPHRIVSLLGVSAPQQASFFSTWVLLLGLSRTPLQLLRLPQLAWYLLRLQLADTPRAARRLWAEQQLLLGYVLPLHTLVLLLGLVFCVASPLIAPIAWLYFVSTTIAQRYQWIYIYRHPYEGAGTLWQQVFAQVMCGVYFFIAIMGCLLGIKRFEYALLLLPLAGLVLVFHVLASRALQRPLTLPSAREAAAVDHRAAQQQHPAAGSDQSAGSGSQAPSTGVQAQVDTLAEQYLAPSLKLNQQQLQPLLVEAADVERRLAALGLPRQC